MLREKKFKRREILQLEKLKAREIRERGMNKRNHIKKVKKQKGEKKIWAREKKVCGERCETELKSKQLRTCEAEDVRMKKTGG